MNRFRRTSCRAALRWIAAALMLVVAVGAPASGSPQTLNAVKARGALVCGVNEGLPGFSSTDESGSWSGFDVDFCRAP